MNTLLLELAVQRGFLTRSQADALAARHGAGSGRISLAEDLAATADLTPADRMKLEAEARRLAEGPSLGKEPARAPGDAEAATGHDAEDLREMPTGRYGSFEPIGEGGMGVVYAALDRELNRRVALKVVRPEEDCDGLSTGGRPQDTAETRALEARFVQEAIVTGSLEHPGIVPIHEIGRTKAGLPYYTMRLIEGKRTLRTALDALEDRPLEERFGLLEPFLRVCDALAYAHAHGVLHRDVKPENVVLGKFGDVILLDWGISKVHSDLQEGDARPSTLLRVGVEQVRAGAGVETHGSGLGTLGYMSPEAVSGEFDRMGPASDVYSLGSMLFEILTGAVPFPERRFLPYARQVLGEDAPRADATPGVPTALADLCTEALARTPGRRPRNAAVFAERVREIERHRRVEHAVATARKELVTALSEARAGGFLVALAALDRASGACTELQRLQGTNAQLEASREEIERLRAQAIAQRERETRRATLRVVAAVAAVVLIVGGAAVAFWMHGKRQEALEAREAAQEARTREVGVRAGT